MKKKSRFGIGVFIVAAFAAAGFSAAAINLGLLRSTQPSQSVGKLTSRSAVDLLPAANVNSEQPASAQVVSTQNGLNSPANHGSAPSGAPPRRYRDWDD